MSVCWAWAIMGVGLVRFCYSAGVDVYVCEGLVYRFWKRILFVRIIII